MKIWMSGEIQGDVFDAFMNVERKIEATLTQYFAEKDFGEGLVKFVYIGIIREIDSPDFDEIKKYHRRDRSVEFRLKISHEIFLRADDLARNKLVVTSVLRALNLVRDLKIKDFDYATFESEVKVLSRQAGWI